jgi:hypothetical protein
MARALGINHVALDVGSLDQALAREGNRGLARTGGRAGRFRERADRRMDMGALARSAK